MVKDENITKTQLRLITKVSSSTFAKLSKNEFVVLDVLVRLCKALDCGLSDIFKISD